MEKQETREKVPVPVTRRQKKEEYIELKPEQEEPEPVKEMPRRWYVFR